MVNRAELTDEEWQTLYGLLLLKERIYVGSEEKCKRSVTEIKELKHVIAGKTKED